MTRNKSVLRIVYLIPETKGYRLKISLSPRQHMSIGKYSGQSAFCCFGYALLFTTFLLAGASESILLLSEVHDKTHRLYFFSLPSSTMTPCQKAISLLPSNNIVVIWLYVRNVHVFLPFPNSCVETSQYVY